MFNLPTESAPETESASGVGFPTATPILDLLRPLPDQEPARLTTGGYFFVSSAVILGLTQLHWLRHFVTAASVRAGWIFWLGVLGVPLLAFVMAIAAHASGHLIAARFTGFEAVRIKVGRVRPKDRLESQDVLGFAFMVLRPRSADRLASRLIWLVLGGPLASIVVPVLPEALLRLAENQGVKQPTLLPAGVHLFAMTSLLIGIGALLPDIDSSGNFSDGTRLLMLLKRDSRGSRLLAMLEMQLGLRSGKPARLWGEDLAARVTAQQDQSFDAVAGNWLVYLWASKRNDLTAATKSLEAALAAVALSPGHLRDRILLEAAIFQAWYRHNLVKAKLWESEIEDSKSLPELERKRLEIAVCWSEGRSFDAWEQLSEHLHRLNGLPASSAHDAAEADAREWKSQMESRLLSGAWATMHSWPYARQTQPVM